jgi:purine-nucleoside phosphorylase
MGDPLHFGSEAPRAAALLLEELGPPDLGIVLGSGFAPLAAALGAGAPVPSSRIPGYPGCAVTGHGGGVAAARTPAGSVWLFLGRLHLYEGHGAARLAFPAVVLAAAGARSVLLTCAAGGLLETDRPGDFVLVADHLNLTGADPLRSILPATRQPPFLDLAGVYDPALREAWQEAACGTGVRLREGVLASVAGPCYETPAEVRMLRALGADLVSMSTVLEAIAAHYLGLRVAALGCVANPGAGMPGGGTLTHGGVLAVVEGAVSRAGRFVTRGCAAMLRA